MWLGAFLAGRIYAYLECLCLYDLISDNTSRIEFHIVQLSWTEEERSASLAVFLSKVVHRHIRHTILRSTEPGQERDERERFRQQQGRVVGDQTGSSSSLPAWHHLLLLPGKFPATVSGESLAGANRATPANQSWWRTGGDRRATRGASTHLHSVLPAGSQS